MAARTHVAPYRVVSKPAPEKGAFAVQVEFIPVHSLKRSPRNARTHSRKQIEQIVASIRHFGWTNPILIDEHGVIIAGHGRLEAAQRMGFQSVPVIVIKGLSDVEQRALALADNKLTLNSGWDRKKLANELGDLSQLLIEYDLTLEITGFESPEIDSHLMDLVDSECDPSDQVAVIEKVAVSRRGDLWRLGKHRLLCGDAREADDYDALMGAKSAAMVFADPPYNVKVSSIQGRGATKHREFVAGSGELSRKGFTQFLRSFLQLAEQHSLEGAPAYICMDWRHLHELLEAGEQVYGELKNLVVWSKTNAGQGSFYRSQHELIFVYCKGDALRLNNVELGKHGRNRSNVWTYAGVNTFRAGRMDELSVHPTVKPVALVADAMRDCTRRGDVVLDPFVGSGTTILAAERVGRIGYGLELDPLYVDATIRRWQAFTRRDAILASTGQTFEEVSARRARRKIERIRLRSKENAHV